MPTAIVKGIQLYLLSPTGERLGILSDSNNSGELLEFTAKVEPYGGLTDFSFNLSRNNPLPISRNTTCHVFVDGVNWFNGYISDIPEPDQDGPSLKIIGKGFISLFQNVIINRSYTSQTLEFIIEDIFSTELPSIDIGFDASKITPPALSSISISFEEVTLKEVIDKLIMVCNYDYTNTKYRYYIDNDKDLVIEEWGGGTVGSLFEGYQYNSPYVEIDNSRIVNDITLFRSTAVDTQDLEYVSTISDIDSQSKYGLVSKKLVFPSYIDTTSMENMGKSLLLKYKEPKKSIEIQDIFISDTFSVGEYKIFNRRMNYWEVINDCDTLDGWDFTNISTASVVMSSVHTLTGRQSLQVDINGSLGEYFEYTLPEPVPYPKILRSYIYFGSAPLQIQVTFTDDKNNISTVNFGFQELPLIVTLPPDEQLIADYFGDEHDIYIDSVDTSVQDQWVILEKPVGDESVAIQLYGNLTAGGADIGFEVNLTIDLVLPLEVRDEISSALFNVSKVKVEILTGTAGTFYIDRFDCYSDIYKTSKLLTEGIEYKLSSTQKSVRVNFGERADSLIDAISDSIQEGNTALSIFTKQ